MPKVHTRKVGEAFREGREAQGHGAISTKCRDGLTIGYSYSEPIAITNGTDVLRTVHQWSVTTSSHAGQFGAAPGGEYLPASTTILRMVAAGRMSWTEAVRRARVALAIDAERQASNGVPFEKHENGYRPQYSYRTEDAFCWREGSTWHLRVGEVVTDHRTLRAARVAAWRRLGLTPLGEWRNVVPGDFAD